MLYMLLLIYKRLQGVVTVSLALTTFTLQCKIDLNQSSHTSGSIQNQCQALFVGYLHVFKSVMLNKCKYFLSFTQNLKYPYFWVPYYMVPKNHNAPLVGLSAETKPKKKHKSLWGRA